jgi:hypothetical protein
MILSSEQEVAAVRIVLGQLLHLILEQQAAVADLF